MRADEVAAGPTPPPADMARAPARAEQPRRAVGADATVPKAEARDFVGRFREILMDPLNLLITRVPSAGLVGQDGLVTLHNGLRVPRSGPGAYYGEFSAILELNRGVHEPLEEFLFQEVLARIQSPGLMIELGAYWAHYSMWAKLRHPRLRCLMVEPDPKHIEAGRANFARHGMHGRFIEDDVGPSGFNLDRFLARPGRERLDILHADIQGAETHLMESGAQSFRRHAVEHLFLSTHGQGIHLRCLEALRGFGYTVIAEADPDTATTSFDGFIMAVAPHRAAGWPRMPLLGRARLCASGPAALVSHLNKVRAAFAG